MIESFVPGKWQQQLLGIHSNHLTAYWIPNLTTQSHEPVGPSAKQSLWGRHWAWTDTWETKATPQPSLLNPEWELLPFLPGHWPDCKYHQTLLFTVMMAAGAGSVKVTTGTQWLPSIVCSLRRSTLPTGFLCFKKKQTWISLHISLHYHRSWGHGSKETHSLCFLMRPLSCFALFPLSKTTSSWESGWSI